MRDVAYNLQGMMGWVPVDAGEEFQGKSRGAQVLEAGSFSATCNRNGGSFTNWDLSAGQYISGVLTSVTASTGKCLVFPMDEDYTIAVP